MNSAYFARSSGTFAFICGRIGREQGHRGIATGARQPHRVGQRHPVRGLYAGLRMGPLSRLLFELVSADMGQASVGVPACLGLSLSRPWITVTALWFVGKLSARARSA